MIPKAIHNEAITYKEMNLGLCSETQTDPTEPQDSNTIRPKQIMRKQKVNYLTHWKELTKKLSILECYLALKQRLHSGRIPEH